MHLRCTLLRFVCWVVAFQQHSLSKGGYLKPSDLHYRFDFGASIQNNSSPRITFFVVVSTVSRYFWSESNASNQFLGVETNWFCRRESTKAKGLELGSLRLILDAHQIKIDVIFKKLIDQKSFTNTSPTCNGHKCRWLGDKASLKILRSVSLPMRFLWLLID